MERVTKKLVKLGKSTSLKTKKGGGRYYGKTRANDLVKKYGERLVSEFPEEERMKLGRMSGTLHFVRLLGLDSRKTFRSIKGINLIVIIIMLIDIRKVIKL